MARMYLFIDNSSGQRNLSKREISKGNDSLCRTECGKRRRTVLRQVFCKLFFELSNSKQKNLDNCCIIGLNGDKEVKENR